MARDKLKSIKFLWETDEELKGIYKNKWFIKIKKLAKDVVDFYGDNYSKTQTEPCFGFNNAGYIKNGSNEYFELRHQRENFDLLLRFDYIIHKTNDGDEHKCKFYFRALEEEGNPCTRALYINYDNMPNENTFESNEFSAKMQKLYELSHEHLHAKMKETSLYKYDKMFGKTPKRNSGNFIPS